MNAHRLAAFAAAAVHELRIRAGSDRDPGGDLFDALDRIRAEAIHPASRQFVEANMSFFQVDRGVFGSSMWLMGTPEEKVLWLWLLGNCDDDGVVRHRELGIAYGSGLPQPVIEAALRKFSEPDPDSRTKALDGRRIDRDADGFVRIVNHELYYSKDYSTPRWRAWKERKGLRSSESRLPTAVLLENVGPTKDKDKDKDKDTNNSNRRSRKLPTPIDAQDYRGAIKRFNRAYALAFGRRASLPPDKARVFADRVGAGYPVEFLIGAPVAVRAAGLDRGRVVQPEYVLRDGTASYVRDGERRKVFDWLAAAWQAADTLKLTPPQADILREVGVLDWWTAKGATVQSPAADEC